MARGAGGAEPFKLAISYVVQYSEDSPNAFRRLRRRGSPPAKKS